jgi:predicted RNase H-like nuclease (RuvC/YqgF family)
MRRDLLCAAVAALLLIPASALAQQQNQSQNQGQQGQTSQQASSQTAAQSSSQSAAPAQAAPVDPLAAAARKAREQKKDQPKPARVFDNDNIPTQGGVSSVGSAPTGESTEGGATAEPGRAEASSKTAAPSGNDEKAWRERFARLHKKLEQDQADLEIMQRELGVLDVQYYNDPMKGMQQGYTRSDINEKTAKIDEKKKQIEADQQALSDAEDELRRSGGDIGWAR